MVLTFAADSTLHIRVEGLYDGNHLRVEADPYALVRSMKSGWFCSLHFFLQLSDGEDHVDGGPASPKGTVGFR